MKVVITGGGGFLGKKLARRILQQGTLADADGRQQKVTELLLFDVAAASGPGLDDPRVKTLAGDIANFATVQTIVQGAATVFHFAAVVLTCCAWSVMAAVGSQCFRLRKVAQHTMSHWNATAPNMLSYL